jgi:hypothetical protein
MPTLPEILQRHESDGQFSAKSLAARMRCSLSKAHNLFRVGRPNRRYEWMRALLRAVPAPVRHAILLDLVDGLDFAVTPKSDASSVAGDPPIRRCVSLTEKWAAFTRSFLDALTDNRVSDAEDSELERMLAEIERGIANVRSAKNSRRDNRGNLRIGAST